MRRELFLSMCALASAAVAAVTTTPSTSDEAPVMLPKVAVTGDLELPPAESWQYARVEGIEVLSNAPTAEANKLLRDFLTFRQALEVVRPAPRPQLQTTSLILCGRAGSFKDLTSDSKTDYDGMVSLLRTDREQATIAINLSLRTIDIEGTGEGEITTDLERTDDQNSSTALETEYIEHHRHLYAEYLRYLGSQSEVKQPAWLTEGMAQIVTDIQFGERQIKFGLVDISHNAPVDTVTASKYMSGVAGGMRAGGMVGAMSTRRTLQTGKAPYRGAAAYRPFNVVLADRPLMPLDLFFTTPRDAREVTAPFIDCRWAKQAYAFVHMCEFGHDGKYTQALAAFVKRLANEPVTETLFRDCFGMSYDEMEKVLRAYIRIPRHKFRDIRLTAEGRLAAPEVKFRAATQGEIGRIKGDAQRLAGRHKDALFTYRVAYARGERDPDLFASLGLEELSEGNWTRAHPFLEAAAKAGTTRPAAYVNLARLRLEAARSKLAGHDLLEAGQLAGVLVPLLKARALTPALPETYTIMAEAWELSSTPPTPSNINLIGEGALKFPTDSALAVRIARLYLRAGDTADATAVAKMAAKFAKDDVSRRSIEQLLAELPAAATSATR